MRRLTAKEIVKRFKERKIRKIIDTKSVKSVKKR